MKKARIGVIGLARKTFDYQVAYQMYLETINKLRSRDDVEFICYEEQVIEVDDAEEAAAFLKNENIDALALISTTFHLGHLALVLNERLDVPMLLWGYPELPYDGGKIRLNSVCGVNLNASNLYKSRVYSYTVSVNNEIDEDWVTAIKMYSSVKNARLALIGYRARGFFNVGVDELDLYSKLGVLIDHYDIDDLYGQEVSEEMVEKESVLLKETFNVGKLSDEQVYKVAKLISSATVFTEKHGIDVMAIRCWPEFADKYGISPCVMMSVLQTRGIATACEGDIEASLSMLACKAAGEETPFMADLSQINFDENFALMWHCGVAPFTLWDKKSERSLETYFAGGRGVTADFVLKSGDVSIFRIDTASNVTRVYYEEGTAVPMDKLLSGTYAKVVFDKNVKEVVDDVVYKGIAHHVILSYRQFDKSVKIFARILGWEVV